MSKNFVNDYPAPPTPNGDYLDYQEMLEKCAEEIDDTVKDLENGDKELFESIRDSKCVLVNDEWIEIDVRDDATLEEVIDEVSWLKINLDRIFEYEGGPVY